MSEKPDIQEMVKRCGELAKNAELINVPTETKRPIVLLRVTEMSEFAFVVWTEENTSTRSQISFCTPNRGGHDVDWYAVVCACCRSEARGLKTPADERDREGWNKRLAREFRDTLILICREKGVHTLFMRRADAWTSHYGVVKDIHIVEAQEHRNALLEDYSRKVIRKALGFIDYERSRGMGDSDW